MSHFAFLQPEWPALFEAASKAEALALPDPRTSCFYARRTLELLVDWVYTHDSSLTRSVYRTRSASATNSPTNWLALKDKPRPCASLAKSVAPRIARTRQPH